MLKNLSLRYKIPFHIAVLILVVAVVVTLSLLLRASEVFKDDLLLSSENLGRVLAQPLVEAMRHDDVWKAYEIINSPFSVQAREGSLQPETVLVLTPDHQVYISTEPEQYPMLTEAADISMELAKVQEQLKLEEEPRQTAIDLLELGKMFVVTPIEADGVLLGNLVMGFSRDIFTRRFETFARRAAVTTVLIIVVLLPLAIYWGRRTAQPLVHLSDSMRRVGPDVPEMDDWDETIYAGGDEIGQLGESFRRMVSELQDKQALERQVIVADRLAAIGRFTAGIAPEINNPLGGMLNAISTHRRHGQRDPVTVQTLSLLERGLLQIKETVAALLVEAKPTGKALTAQDIEDTRTLVQSEAAKKQARIEWNNLIGQEVLIPANMVRQILINLLLNAIQAVPDSGRVQCSVGVEHGCLNIFVENEGEQITDEQMAHLFEPFTTGRESGRGLGLWVTYQIVHSLGGQIEVSSGDEDTRFVVMLPVQEAA
ncbi:MAG: two-component sensor histidine kinase [Gammaproteobacteria bacterium]|nr:MAG: two-component sensor histidine kinase [Gammaproteobacteria bacterium]